MAVVPRRQTSALVSNGLSMATVALSIAGAATDAIPIAKQILNSAAHISAAAERINRKREAMYSLLRKVDAYSTQIDIAVAGRLLDPRLEHRLARLLSLFVKIEELLEEKAGRKKYPARVWNKLIAKPNRAEELAAELDQEMTLFNLLTGIQLSLTVDDTARAVAEDARYDGQFRRLRDCEVEKLDVIYKCQTPTDVVVWSSALVDGQVMVVRYIEPLPTSENKVAVTRTRWQSLPVYDEFLKNIERVSTIRGSHRYIVQLYGRHVCGPEAVFKSGPGTIDLYFYLKDIFAEEGYGENAAVKRLRLAYKILDASAHLDDVHGLKWVGDRAIIDEKGEPRIGLFDDIVWANRHPFLHCFPFVYWNIFASLSFPSLSHVETGAVEQVHDSSLHTIITERLRDNDTDRLHRVWDTVRQHQLHVVHNKSVFPIISGNLSLSQELIARARVFFATNMKEQSGDPYWNYMLSFARHVIGGGADISSRICISMRRRNSEYIVEVYACTNDGSEIRHDEFWIDIPTECPLLAEVARAVGLPDDFEHSWDGSRVYIHQQYEDEGEHKEEENEIRDGESADKDSDDIDAWGSSEEEDEEEYETEDEGETSSDVASEE